MSRLSQCVIVLPDPSHTDVMLACNGRPFLGWVLRELIRFGVAGVVLVSARSIDTDALKLPKPLSLTVLPPQALASLHDRLHPRYLALRGGWWTDANLGVALGEAARSTEPLRRIVEGGLYVVSREAVNASALPRLFDPASAVADTAAGESAVGRVIDIATGEGRAFATQHWTAQLIRPAVFFDRDGVLNADTGYVTRDRFEWLPGAREAVRLVNERGFHAFVVTNQSGVARGYFTEDDVRNLHAFMADALSDAGAFIDDWFFCPHHRDGVLDVYRRDCGMRKPAPGMIRALLARWQVDPAESFMIGDKTSDIEAAHAAGIAGHGYDGDVPLDRFIERLLPARR